MTETQMALYELDMSSDGWSTFYQGRTREFKKGTITERWERVNAKWALIGRF